jgi:excisionase family DNA binding protein
LPEPDSDQAGVRPDAPRPSAAQHHAPSSGPGLSPPPFISDRPITRTDVLRATDVADLLGVSKSTVEEWARRGLLPSRKRGKRRFFLRWEIEAWLITEDGTSSRS